MKKNISARFTVKPRKFEGKTFHLACQFCVFPTKEVARENAERKREIYTRMSYRVIELPKSQQLINFDDRSKPLKYAVMEAYKQPQDEPKGRGLRELFD